MSITELLNNYKNSFNKRTESFVKECVSYGMTESDAKKYAKQKIASGVNVKNIPTIDTTKQRTVSTQLKERFAYAGSWKDIGEHFLDPEQIDLLVKKPKFKKWIKSMRENWENSAPWLYSDDKLSVISVSNENDGGFTLLVWIDETKEPEVWRYSGQCEQKFSDLFHWLQWLNSYSVL